MHAPAGEAALGAVLVVDRREEVGLRPQVGMAANTRSAPRTSTRKSCTSATRCASPLEPSGPPGAILVAPGAVAVLASTTRAYVVARRRATPKGAAGRAIAPHRNW